MRISIAMCTYNGALYLGEQLESIARQTVLPDELVVCDDGSSDDTLKILKKFRETLAFPVYVNSNFPQLGTIRNFERAITLSRGEIIFLSDQDDVWKPNKIEIMNQAMNDNPACGYVFSDAELVDDALNPKSIFLWDAIGFTGERYERFSSGEQLDVMLKGGNFVYGNCLAFRSAYNNKILPIESDVSSFTHDTWISLLLSASGARGVSIPEPLIQYRQHGNQQAGAGRELSLREKVNHTTQSKEIYFLSQSRVLRGIKERVLLDANRQQVSRSLALLDECITHLEARGSLYGKTGLAKVPVIMAELASGRYSRFSSSWKSALKDLVTT